MSADTSAIYFAIWNKSDIPYGDVNEYFVYAESTPADGRYVLESLDKLRTKTDAFAFKKTPIDGICSSIIGDES